MSSDLFDDTSDTVSAPSPYERVIGYIVQDSDGQEVGKVHNLWIDDTAQPLFLGVKTGWLSGQNHVVPIGHAEVNDHRKLVRLPFAAEQIKHAPSFDEDTDLAESDQDSIFAYYGIQRSPATLSPADETEASFRREISPQVLNERMETPVPVELQQDLAIQLNEEQVGVGKREVEASGIRLRKIVRAETVNKPVPLQPEEIVLERASADDTASPAQSFGEEDVFIPLRRG